MAASVGGNSSIGHTQTAIGGLIALTRLLRRLSSPSSFLNATIRSFGGDRERDKARSATTAQTEAVGPFSSVETCKANGIDAYRYLVALVRLLRSAQPLTINYYDTLVSCRLTSPGLNNHDCSALRRKDRRLLIAEVQTAHRCRPFSSICLLPGFITAPES